MTIEQVAALRVIEQTDGIEVHQDDWDLYTPLIKAELVTMGPARGPGGAWRRVTLVMVPKYKTLIPMESKIDLPSVEEYKVALRLVEAHKVCGNSIAGCGKLFKMDEVQRTIDHGQIWYWCPSCYEPVKKD